MEPALYTALFALNNAIRQDPECKELTEIRDRIWALGQDRFGWKD